MRSPRNWFFLLAAISIVFAFGTTVLMAAGDQLVFMVMLDATSSLRSNGTISESQYDTLASDIAKHTRPAFGAQRYIPAGLFVALAVAQLLAGLFCPRTIVHGTGGTRADTAA